MPAEIHCSAPSGRAEARGPFYALPKRNRRPFWRVGLALLFVVGLHVLALLAAFGSVMRPLLPEVLATLSVRVIEPPPIAPRLDQPRMIDLPTRVERPRAARAPTPTPTPKPTPKPTPAAALAKKALSPPTILTAASQTPSMIPSSVPEPPAGHAVAIPAPVPPPTAAARFEADYLKNPKPVYPVVSRRLGEEGRVVLRVRVNAEGLPVLVEIRQSSGFQRLDEAARAAVERWRFVPARQGSETIESSVLVPLQFTLDS